MWLYQKNIFLLVVFEVINRTRHSTFVGIEIENNHTSTSIDDCIIEIFMSALPNRDLQLKSDQCILVLFTLTKELHILMLSKNRIYNNITDRKDDLQKTFAVL